MTKNRNLSDLLDTNGDVKSAHLDNVPASDNASALTTGTLPDARLSNQVKVVKGTSAPNSPQAGDLWYDTNSGINLLVPEKGKLNVWLLVGVNGVGKTTTLGKLAYLSSRSNYKTLIAAADTFRAAAVEQLKVWGERSNVDVISNQSTNADPAAVVFDAINSAQKRNCDLLLVDTAGRLQTKNNLMDELSKIKRIIDKKVPDAIVESLLVLDASQGQNGLKQAKSFAKSANLSGAIITKLDGSSRGGVSLAVSAEVNLPIRFIGAGEGIKDLRPFNSFEFVEALLADR